MVTRYRLLLLLLLAATPPRGDSTTPHPYDGSAYTSIPSSLEAAIGAIRSSQCRRSCSTIFCAPGRYWENLPRSTTTFKMSTSESDSGRNDEEKVKQSADLGRRARKKKLRKLEYKRRRDRWTRRYGSLEALQVTFGKGPLWGDLNPTQTRALYHTLLPRSLMALNDMGLMKPDELAPLAYQARIAAKEYARSRCVWTGRIGTSLFDQYRNLRDRGSLLKPGSSSSMSWEEIWAKYEGQIVKEVCEGVLKDGDSKRTDNKKQKELDEKRLAMLIYLRILERSCATNQAFDSLFLNQDGSADDIDLVSIASQLDSDVRSILLHPADSAKATKKAEKMKKKQQKALQKEENRQRTVERKEEKRKRKQRSEEEEKIDHDKVKVYISAAGDNDGDDVPDQEYSQGYQALRILAGTRRQFKLLFSRSK